MNTRIFFAYFVPIVLRRNAPFIQIDDNDIDSLQGKPVESEKTTVRMPETPNT
jgi:hypothetical protein